MKNILKTILFSVLISGAMTSCDDDTDIPYIDKPLFKETFSNNFTDWVVFSQAGAQGWVIDPTYGNPNPNNGGSGPNPCAKMSGFSGTSVVNSDWLISPAQDLSKFAHASFAFDSAVNFTGPNIEVYVSKNYSGAGDPDAAGVVWKRIENITLAKVSVPIYTYAFSGVTDVPGFAGAGCEAVYFAFKYTSSATAAATWEIDNFKVYGTN